MDRKEILLESLTKEQLKTIQKENPFIVERNAAIGELFNRGVSCFLLEEISGIGHSSIQRIAKSDHLEVKGKSRHEWIKKHNQEGKK
jgi:hypothetical protein